MRYMKRERLKNLITIAILSALAFLVMVLVKISVVPAAPFLRYDPKDVVIVIGGFLFGPLAALSMSIIVALMEMLTVSTSGFIGFFMNSISSAAFTCTAAFIYKKKRTIAGAIIGLASGVIMSTAVMILWNYLITPIFMSTPREVIATLLIPVFLPFNLIKGTLNAGIAMLVYKPLSKALRKLNIMPKSESNTKTASSRKLNIGVLAVSCFIIITCVMIVLVINKVI